MDVVRQRAALPVRCGAGADEQGRRPPGPARPAPVAGLAFAHPVEAGPGGTGAPAIARLRRRAASRPAARGGPAPGGVGTIRRMLGTVTVGPRGKAVTTWDDSVVATTAEKEREQEMEYLPDGEPNPAAKTEIKASRARTAAELEAGARDQRIQEARISVTAGAQKAHMAHWALMLRYGTPEDPRWLKVDLIEAGYRTIWRASAQAGDVVPLPVTIGALLDAARAVARENTLYYNPDEPDATIEARGHPRYSCQHFLVQLMAQFGVTLRAAVVPD